MDSNRIIIDISDLSFGYPGSPLILDSIDLRVRQKDCIGLMGSNGSGKTTLFRVIMGLIKPVSGKMLIFEKPVHDEKDFREVRKRIGLLFQDADDQLFSPTVLEDVAFGPLNLGSTMDEAIQTARETLDFLGMSGFENRVTYKLSGGEKRMISLATVLAMKPEMLLLDEPTSGLDSKTHAKLTEVLTEINLPCMIISHEMDFLEKTTDKIFLMENGKILTDSGLHIHHHVHVHSHGSVPHKHE